MKGVQCYELFGGIALKIHTFSFFHFYGNTKVAAPISSLTTEAFVFGIITSSADSLVFRIS